MESLIFDTTFLIDFQRERRTSPGAAHSFLEVHSEAIAYLPITAYGEFAEGFASRTDSIFLSMVESFELVPITRAIADTYAQITRRLRAKGRLIGANDLWIAASALQKNIPLVTRNAAEFSRIEGLEIRFY
jgi:tRNA(fMet)-specific endonuclease VapC